MKVLTPLIILCACAVNCFAQIVPMHVQATTAGAIYTPDQSSLSKWQSEHVPTLFGFPVSISKTITGGESSTFAFRSVERVILVVQTGMKSAEGKLVCTTPDGTVLTTRHITGNMSEFVIEIPQPDFILTYQHTSTKGVPQLEIMKAYLVPQPDQSDTRDFGFDTSLDCNPNANCPEGLHWSDQVRSLARIMMVLEEGVGWCSGTLMNNTAEDGRPLMLSAEHCLAEYTPNWNLWRFDFNYGSASCMNPVAEPELESITGCVLRAKQRDTDFMLLELNEQVPVFYNTYFSGWNRTMDYAPSRSVLVHHPSGDIAKMSTDFHQIRLWENSLIWNEGYTTPENTHFRNRFDSGTFEPGSSGGAIIDTSGHVIGQLHGGIGDCNANTAYSGRLSASWDYSEDETGRLMDWLDPIGTGAMILDGMEHPDVGNVYQVTGVVRNSQGDPVRDVEIRLEGGVVLTVNADTNGVFTLPELPRSSEIIFSARKNVNPRNGVSATDLLLIKKHLLGDTPFADSWQILASDATGNGTVSAGDILILQKLLLGLVPVLPTQDAWTFDPPQINIIEPGDSNVQLEFTAIKVGDVNGTADPNQ